MTSKISSAPIATTVFLISMSVSAQRADVSSSSSSTPLPTFGCSTQVQGASDIAADSGVDYTENDPPYNALMIRPNSGDCDGSGKSTQKGTSPDGSSMLASASAKAATTWTVANGSFQFSGNLNFVGSAITNSANVAPPGGPPLYEFAVAEYEGYTNFAQTTLAWKPGQKFTFKVLCSGFYATCVISDGGPAPLYSGKGVHLYSGSSDMLEDATTLTVQTTYPVTGKAESGGGTGLPAQSTTVDALGQYVFTVSPVLRSPGQGGGAAEYADVIGAEMSEFNLAPKGALFAPNVPTPSQVGLTGFINNDYSCDENSVNGINGGACSGTVGGAATVNYAETDVPLSAEQISAWASSPVGRRTAGRLIQLPAMGFGVAIPIVNAAVTVNGGVALSDQDLCGVFSGKITDFQQISDAGKLAPGFITVVYDTDISGVTLALTSHLAEVCGAADSAIKFRATSNFASLFYAIPSNFHGSSGAVGVANYLASLSGTTVTSAVGYATPVYTSLIVHSTIRLANGELSPLRVASVLRGKSAELPTAANIESGLSAPMMGENLAPPTNATEGANPALWAPKLAVTEAGYPIVGYTYFVVAACYAQSDITHAVVAFLKDHFTKLEYQNIQIANGFAPLPDALETGQWRTAVVDNLLEDTNEWGINIGNTNACSGVAGR